MDLSRSGGLNMQSSRITFILDLLRRIISKKNIADVCSEPGELVQIYGKRMRQFLKMFDLETELIYQIKQFERGVFFQIDDVAINDVTFSRASIRRMYVKCALFHKMNVHNRLCYK